MIQLFKGEYIDVRAFNGSFSHFYGNSSQQFSSWGGYLKLKNCSVANIEPKPNRFVWVNPNVWHGIEAVNDTANTNRITVVAWPSGTLEYAGANLRINTL